MARYVANDFVHKYKYYVYCDHCGKEFFIWMKHIPGAFVDHFGPDFCCEECERKYNEEHKIELDEQKRQWTEPSNLLSVIKVSPPSPIRTELFEEKPMMPPTDEIHFVEAMMRRTRINI